MELNVSKNNVKTLRKVAESENEASYEWDIIVPDSKPDIKTILKSGACCYLTGKEIMQDRAMLSGEAAINILYIPQDGTNVVRNIESTQHFNYVMELSGLRQDMSLNCCVKVMDVRAKIINSRKISVLCVLSFGGTVSAEDEVVYVDALEGDNVECLKKKIKACKTVSDCENTIEISEEFEIPMGKPSAGEILELKMKFNERDVRTMDGKILIKGEIGAVVIYNSESEGDELQYVEFTVPFTEIFDDERVSEDSFYDADFYIENAKCVILPDSEGENRIFLIEATVSVCGKGYENIELEAVVDAYSKDGELSPRISGYDFNEISGICENRAVIKDTVEVDDQSPVNKIINILAIERVKSVATNEGNVIVAGNITADILYHSDKNDIPISYITKDIPFEVRVECAESVEGSTCEVKTMLNSISYNILNPKQFEIKMLLDVRVRLLKHVEDNILSDVEISPDAPNGKRNGLTVYFCDGTENLWDIAKKYRTSIKEITELNDITSETVERGMKLLIP